MSTVAPPAGPTARAAAASEACLRAAAPELVAGRRAQLGPASEIVARRLVGAVYREGIAGDVGALTWSGDRVALPCAGGGHVMVRATRHAFDRVEVSEQLGQDPARLLCRLAGSSAQTLAIASELTDASVNLALALARRASHDTLGSRCGHDTLARQSGHDTLARQSGHDAAPGTAPGTGAGAGGGARDSLDLVAGLDADEACLFFERLAVEGHNLHPCGRTRLGWSVADLLAHDLESPGTSVRLLAVRREAHIGDDVGAHVLAGLDGTSLDGTSLDGTGLDGGGAGHKAGAGATAGLVADAGLDPARYVVTPVHAWQYKRVVRPRYADLLADRVLVPLAVELPAWPTAALRTLLLSRGRPAVPDETRTNHDAAHHARANDARANDARANDARANDAGAHHAGAHHAGANDAMANPARANHAGAQHAGAEHGGASYVKVSLDIQVTSTRRTISVASTRNGPTLSRLLAAVVAEGGLGGRALLMAETAGSAVVASAGRARDLAAIARDGLRGRLATGEVPVPGVALCATSPVTGRAVVAELVTRYARTRSRVDGAGAALAFVAEYARLLLTPVLGLAARHGIALEAHLQNCVPLFVDGVPSRIAFRDFAGLRVYPPRVVRDLELWPGSVVVTGELDIMRAKLAYTALQANLGEVVVRLAASHGLDEGAAWARVREIIDDVYDELGTAAGRADHAFLTGPTLPHKALLRMRLAAARGRSGDIYRGVENPLR